MWHTVENGEAVRPAEVDNASSRAYVYVRRNIELVEATEDMPAHYRWEEQAIPHDYWPIYERVMQQEQDTLALCGALAEVAEMVVGGGA